MSTYVLCSVINIYQYLYTVTVSWYVLVQRDPIYAIKSTVNTREDEE